MQLDQWAARWGIPNDAIDDFKKSVLNLTDATKKDETADLSEKDVQNLIRMEASERNVYLWRNNVGAAYMRDGSFLRYGLANDSSALNSKIKSADLIGIRPVKITQEMVGYTLGQFVSREIKSARWKYTGSERERAQLAWAELILSCGGDACFANKRGTL
jgi:hypothetical protein